MGKLRCLAACLAILLCAAPLALAESSTTSPAPFTRADIDQISDNFETVGDYAAALSPTSYSWVYQGAATGESYLTMRTDAADGTELGETTVSVSLDDQLIDGVEEGQRETLPEGLNDIEAWLVDARWMSADYALPCIRGIKPGASGQDVVAAFFSHSTERPDYTIHDINPAVDETWLINENARVGGFSFDGEDGGVDFVYGWCTLDAPDEWREYDQLIYHTAGSVVLSIDLTYSSDPE